MVAASRRVPQSGMSVSVSWRRVIGCRLTAAFGVPSVAALIGDSIMEELAVSIADSLSGVGIQTSRHTVSGSGLLSGSVDYVPHRDP